MKVVEPNPPLSLPTAASTIKRLLWTVRWSCSESRRVRFQDDFKTSLLATIDAREERLDVVERGAAQLLRRRDERDVLWHVPVLRVLLLPAPLPRGCNIQVAFFAMAAAMCMASFLFLCRLGNSRRDQQHVWHLILKPYCSSPAVFSSGRFCLHCLSSVILSCSYKRQQSPCLAWFKR